jgi:amino acid adenylation domain-containing protein
MTEQTATRIPAWTDPGAEPSAGFARLRVPVPAPMPAAAVLLAAHAKVVGALTSQTTVITGYRTTAGQGARSINLAAGTWRALIQTAPRITDVPPGLETELDLRGPESDTPGPGIVLRATATPDGLALCYRQDRLNADAAARIAGYYTTALRLIASAPDAPHDQVSLLPEAELAYQANELAGPRDTPPSVMFPRLFQEQVVARPGDLACAHRGLRWTYSELHARASSIANALLFRGLRPGDVVTVVMERNLDWLAAIIGVLKAGGTYLPVRPDFPAERVAVQLSRSDSMFAVTEPGSEDVLHAALARAGRTAAVVYAAHPGADTADPDVPVTGDLAAYIFFTSGSTGEPKGALCEHAGMLNHLTIKVRDMGLRAGDVVAQLASQGFDISLWQLLAPLLAGGSTEIIDDGVQLDVTAFIDRLAAGGIAVIQVVPGYLDVLLSHLERHPRDLGDLRSVSVTGEVLRAALVRRWFALYPRIPLVNAYGATEVCDDAMHAILTGPPARDFVSIGVPRHNVITYILEERSRMVPPRMVPLGASGEIAFSGVCVGRGYVNDPERTAQAFGTDPYQPGNRLYRTGDYGRWLPDGTVEFLGRRDEQVKIRGYRIELGEIENRLLKLPGVKEAAAVICGESLAAFVTGPDAPQPADQRDFLAAALPDYMLPSYFHQLDALPRTENGKVDKLRLTAAAVSLAEKSAAYVPPVTDTERRLATAWAEVLNSQVGRIGTADDFFNLGGTSLSAVRLVVALDRVISLRQLVATPVLGELAREMDTAGVLGLDRPVMLQRLSSPGPSVATLVCFPYAGGNAVNFQLLARALEGTGIDVRAVELSGHDIAHPDEPLASVEQVVCQVLPELPATGPVLIWGHCAGAAHAVELARLMTERGRPPDRLFLGAMLLGETGLLRAEMTEVTELTSRQITARLHAATAYIELDLMKTERAELLGRAYRHDVCSTNRYLLSLAFAARLPTPVEVVVADDDPATSGYARRYRRWTKVADEVTLHALPDGGHYFIRSRAAEAAAVITSTLPARLPA